MRNCLLALSVLLAGCGEFVEPMIEFLPAALAAQEVQREVQSLFRELGIRPTEREFQEANQYFASTLQLIPKPEAPQFPPSDTPLPGLILRPVPQLNDTELLVDAPQIFPELLRMIQGAKNRIQVDIFLLGGDTGMEVAQALVQKHREGVQVELMLDPKFGLGGPTSKGIQQVVTYLKEQALPFKLYPLHLFGKMPNRVQSRMQIDHNKVVVVDQRTMLIGGMNFDDIARPNHDLMLRITGPAAEEASAMLAAEWPLGLDPQAAFSTQAVGQVFLSQTAPQQKNTKAVLLDLIAKAKRSVHVTMYEFGDAEMAQALCEAHRRGLDVRLILDPKAENLKKYGVGMLPDGFPNWLPARELVKAGAPVRWFVPYRPQQELHMKMMVVDGDTAVIGSTNWTPNAFSNYRETGAVVQGATGAKVEALFQTIWNEHSRPITKLTLRQQILARLAEFLNRKKLAFY